MAKGSGSGGGGGGGSRSASGLDFREYSFFGTLARAFGVNNNQRFYMAEVDVVTSNKRPSYNKKPPKGARYVVQPEPYKNNEWGVMLVFETAADLQRYRSRRGV